MLSFLCIVHNELAKRLLILQQMLIDTSHINHHRANFATHFNTKRNSRITTNEIRTLTDRYPTEMTSQIRRWLDEQQQSHIESSLTSVDMIKSIDNFEAYLKDIEEKLRECQRNENSSEKLKV